jgi:RHS repeat-associated protein
MVGYNGSSGTASYVYDDSGNRVQETTGTTTEYYLTDTQNPTGYAQPLEVHQSSISSAPNLTYLIGDRIFGQANSSGGISYLSIDGHGSTQQITNASGAVTAALAYTAYGTALNFNPAAIGSVYLFGGDAVYDPISGLYMHGDGRRDTVGFRFIQEDPSSSGNNSDPTSLHLYLYASANPISDIDPSGYFTQAFGNSAHDVIGRLYQEEYPGTIINPDIGVFGILKPDIFDVFRFKYAEIKPFSFPGITSGFLQIVSYDEAYGKDALNYTRDTSWPGGGFNFTVAAGVQLFFWNVEGIIFYTDQTEESEELEENVKDKNSAYRELRELDSQTDEVDEEAEDGADDELDAIENQAEGEVKEVAGSDEADLGDDIAIDTLDSL